jgi:hypothetical protein
MRKTKPGRLPRFASRRRARRDTSSRILEIMHKLVTGAAALAALLRLLL